MRDAASLHRSLAAAGDMAADAARTRSAASVPQPPGRATGLPGAALLARCTAQSCDNKGMLLSLSVEQCSCGCSWTAVQGSGS